MYPRNHAKRLRDKPIGTLHHTGYLVHTNSEYQYRVHRLIWIWHNGAIPEKLQIDHQDRNKLNNRIENLRLVTHYENSLNQSLSPLNTSGIAGVVYKERTFVKGWEASIRYRNKYYYLGKYKSFEEAVAARKAAEICFGFHPNHATSTKSNA